MFKRLLASFGLSSGIMLVSMLAQIISVPILLARWGTATYGEWLLLTGLASSLSIMNFGVQSYVCNLLIASYTKQEIEEGTRLLQSALYLYILFTSLATALLIMLGTAPGLLTWIKVQKISAFHSRAILTIYGILAIYAIPGGLLLSLFQVTKQMPRQLMYGLLERVILLYSPMLIAWSGGQPIIAAVTTAVLSCILIIIELYDVRQRSPFTVGLSYANWSLAFSFIKPGLTFFTVSLAALMSTTGITVLLANHSGGQAVALFSTTIILGNFSRTLVNQGMNVLWPEITEAGVLYNSSDRLSRWYFLLLKLAGGFILICTLGICALGNDILSIWTQNQMEIDPTLNLLLAIYLAIQAPMLVSSAFALALNRQADLLKIQIAMGFITLSSGFLLIQLYGVYGAALSLILGQSIIIPSLLRSACRWVNAIWKDFLWRDMPRLMLGFCFVLFISLILAGASINFREKVYYTFAAIPIILAMIWYYWLLKSEKKFLLNIITFFFKNNSND